MIEANFVRLAVKVMAGLGPAKFSIGIHFHSGFSIVSASDLLLHQGHFFFSSLLQAAANSLRTYDSLASVSRASAGLGCVGEHDAWS